MSSLEEVARRLFWWLTPEEALADSRRFIAQVMVYGNLEDVVAMKARFPESELRAVLLDPPRGLFDPRSWAYWHLVLGLEAPPAPPPRFTSSSP